MSVRRKTTHPNDTYKRLVETAMEIFARKGYDATTTRDLAESAEVSLSAINYHFGSKIDLYRAAAEHAAKMMLTPLNGQMSRIWECLAQQPSREACIEELIGLLSSVAAVMLAPGYDIKVATQFAMHELVAPAPGSGILTQRVVTPIIECASALLTVVLGPIKDENALEVLATSLFGPITVYRILNNHSLESMTARKASCIQKTIQEFTICNVQTLIDTYRDGGRSLGRNPTGTIGGKAKVMKA